MRLDNSGVLLDFSWLKSRLDETLADLHNRDLNKSPSFADCPPSAENIAAYVAKRLGVGLPAGVRLCCVEVEETPGCTARYRPDAAAT